MPAAEPRQTTPREWAVAIGGGIALSAVLVAVLRGGDEAPTAALPPAVVQPVAAPPPLPPAQATLSPPASPPAVAPKLILRGIVERPGGAAAVIETGDGRQRLVRVGGQVAPGVRLEQVMRSSVALSVGAARQVLRFDGADAAAEPVAPAVPPAVAGLAGSVNAYRLGMEASRRGGRIRGFSVVDTARLPLLQQAGIRPGDVVLAVNGAPLVSEEKLMELPSEVAGAYRVEISFERGGQPMSATVDVQKPQ